MARTGPGVITKEEKEKLLSDPSIRRWYDGMARGSNITADVYFRRLAAVCRQCKTTPQNLLKLKEQKLYDMLMDFIGEEEGKKRAGSFIETSLKSVRSWLSHNGKQFNRRIKIPGAKRTPTLENEQVPSQDELRRIFLAATPKDRISCVLIAHSGLRPETLGNYKGKDGLRVKDLPEMHIKDGKVEFGVIPTMVVVRPELSKGRNRYFTFLSEEGCEYLKDYLEDRIRQGEKLEPETDIIHPKVSEKRFVCTINIGDGIRTAIRAAGFRVRPYVLRAYFDTQLLLAESKGKITHSYRQFFMGHVGDMEARYTTNKGRLTKDMIEDMREAYKRCQTFLQTAKKTGKDEEELKIMFRRQLLMVAGMTEKEIDGLNLETMGDEEVQDMLRRKLLGAMANNGNRQKVVLVGDVESYIQQGWEYVGSLANNKAIMKLPDNINGAFSRV
jgi:integrase